MAAETKKASILYIDDEVRNLETFVAAFRRFYNIYAVNSTQEAINVLRNHEIAVIITDQRMPDMTGVQFLEAIIPEFSAPVRILMTGYSDADAVIKAINKAKIFHYVAKPWDDDSLKQIIDSGIKLYHLEKEKNEVIHLSHEKSYQLERMINIFSKYVPEKIVKDTLNNYQGIDALFNGEERIVSVLFATIHNMNQLYERVSPQNLHNCMNDFFSVMADIITEHNGIVDKFVNGSILAIFGAPVSHLENQKNAAFCALSMIEKLNEINAKQTEAYGCDIKMGISIHSGETVVGNIGSDQYMAYTAIGDTVNTASRVNEITRGFQNSILITDTIYGKVRENVETVAMGETKMRGKEARVNLYKVMKKRI